MNMPLAFPVFVQRPDIGVYKADTAAMDWFVIATLCFFFFLLGCFATAAWQIWRRSTRPTPHEQLLMELAESDEEKFIQTSDEKPRDPEGSPSEWEKSPDWWKQ